MAAQLSRAPSRRVLGLRDRRGDFSPRLARLLLPNLRRAPSCRRDARRLLQAPASRILLDGGGFLISRRGMWGRSNRLCLTQRRWLLRRAGRIGLDRLFGRRCNLLRREWWCLRRLRG